MRRRFLKLILIPTVAFAAGTLVGDTAVQKTAGFSGTTEYVRAGDYEAGLNKVDQGSSFIPIEGADLKSKLDAAIRRARADSQHKRSWAAYSFEVRPGVSVDVNLKDGPRQIFSAEPNISLDPEYETRNLGVFLLYDVDADAIIAAEIYNLDTHGTFAGHPVYWLGKATGAESLSLLKPLAESSPVSQIAEHAAVAIAIHNYDPVGAALEEVIRRSSNEKTRSVSILWLSQIPNELTFLTDLVRNERETVEVRKQAVFAIGVRKDVEAVQVLKNLYETASGWDIKQKIIFAAYLHSAERQATDLLMRIAEADPDRHARKEASFWLAQSGHGKR